MYRKEVNEKSPLRILERSMHGGLGGGSLGVVMARAGVGKTAFLVQIGLDDAMRERPVLHIALQQNLEHVQSWYDALFEDLARIHNLEDRDEVRALWGKHHVIQAYQDANFTVEKLEETLALYERSMQFTPKVILIDGFPWEGGKVVESTGILGALKSVAKRLGAELWMSAQTHRSVTKDHPTKITPPCADYVDLIDVAVYLEPVDNQVHVRLLKDHDNPTVDDTHLALDADTMRLHEEQAPSRGLKLKPSGYTLLSGGARGAEAAFGEAAERWGVQEMNFTFEGHKTERERGLVILGQEELRQGEVSEAYVKAKLHRTFPSTPLFQNILQSIWHQIATAGEVFVVGELQEDNTVKGGTGWGAELARHFRKPLYVFDQEKRGWFTWTGSAWESVEQPRITRARFAGTGTRFLSDAGKEAINKLFEATLGPAEG